MRLRQKTLLIIGATLVSLVGVLYATTATILLGSVTQAEQKDTRQIIRGVLSIFDQTQADFSDRFADWAAWDDMYRFIEDGNPQYRESNLQAESLATIKVNLAVLVHTSGRIVFGTGFDLKTQQFTPIPPELQKRLVLGDRLLQHPHPQSQQVGLVMLPAGPMLLMSRPILTSDGQGPVRGSLIFGRYLDAVAIERLSRITRLPLMLHRVDDPQLPADFQAAYAALKTPSDTWVQPLNQNLIAGYTLLPDLYGEPALILRTDIPREIYHQGQASLRYLVFSLLIVGVVFVVMTLWLLEKLVLARLAHLSGQVSQIEDSSDLALRVQVQGADELSSLGLTINQMLETLERSREQEQAYLKDLEVEREKSERLLLNILPQPIADRLKQQEANIADTFAEATVLFADLVDFTQLASVKSPTQLVKLLNHIFSMFDVLAEKYGLEKIKTIGDAYMVVGGLPTPRTDHAIAIAEMALGMQAAIAEFNAAHHENLCIRIGINTGPVVAGIIGTKKFIYDLWGDTVNIASRMESHGLVNNIQVTAATYELLKREYVLEERGTILIKGKGEMVTYLLMGKKPASVAL